jgi:hypothetical protein
VIRESLHGVLLKSICFVPDKAIEQIDRNLLKEAIHDDRLGCVLEQTAEVIQDVHLTKGVLGLHLCLDTLPFVNDKKVARILVPSQSFYLHYNDAIVVVGCMVIEVPALL